MLKKLIVSLSIFSCAMFSMAQEISVSKSLNEDNGYFNHLDVSASIGSPGIGIDVSAPVGEYVKLRAGMTYMPRFEMSSNFRVQVGDSLERKFDQNGNRIETKFDKLSGMLKGMTGFDVDDQVAMNVKPTFYNFRFMVDVYPFQDKRWHFTAGFYAGPAEIGRGVNVAKDVPTLMAVSMYNMMFDRIHNGEDLFDLGGNLSFSLPPEVLFPIMEKLDKYGRMGVHVGNYLNDGPVLLDESGEPLEYDENGNPLLAYYKGDPYMMVPDANGMVSARAKTNRFKPYLGFGYGGAISRDGRTELSVDAGVMFWGGKPHVYTHDGTDLVYDVEKISGKVGRYVRYVKSFPCFPVLELKVTRRIF